MPGAIPHLLTGALIFLIGIYFYEEHFNTLKKQFLLGILCIFFTLLPDLVFILYYSTYFLPKTTLEPFHILFHQITFIIAIILITLIQFLENFRIKPVLNISLICIIAHYILDFFIVDTSVWI